MSDGNGWVDCGCGARHWGLHGAAGVFLTVDDHVLLQLRPEWAHQGGSWAIPGGARDSHETVVEAALREAHEETALVPGLITVNGVRRLQHPDWRYDTVLAAADQRPALTEHEESVELRWVPIDGLGDLPLHPGFAEALPDLMLPRVTLLVDAANVVGSRPDGWWKDRAGAAGRLLAELELLAGQVVELDGSAVLLQQVEAVVEGQANAVPDPELDKLVVLTRAPGSGDDMIASRARTLDDVVVVTSDRGLRDRVARSISVSRMWDWLR